MFTFFFFISTKEDGAAQCVSVYLLFNETSIILLFSVSGRYVRELAHEVPD